MNLIEMFTGRKPHQSKSQAEVDEVSERVRMAARRHVDSAKNLEATINDFLDAFPHNQPRSQ